MKDEGYQMSNKNQPPEFKSVCQYVSNFLEYDGGLTAKQGNKLIHDLEDTIEVIKSSFEYAGEYFYLDPMGSTFSNENKTIIICYGHTKDEVRKICEEKGFKKSEDNFDGGYSIIKNPKFNKGGHNK